MTRMIRSSLIACALMLLVASSLTAQDRGQEVLAQARAALFGKSAPGSASSLAVTATVRRVVEAVGMELNSTTQLELLLPDKYRRTEEMSIGPVTRLITVGLNGEQLFYDDGGAAAMVGVDPTAPGPARDEMIKGMKEDTFRMFTVLILAPPSHLSCTIASGGVAEAPDGKADVVDVKGPDRMNLRLFFDTVSHRLLLATYETESIDAEQLKALTQKAMDKAKANPGDIKKLTQEMRAEQEKLPKKKITVHMRFSEPKNMNGMTLPAKMVVEGGPQGTEEWTFTSVKLNPTLKPERFAK